MLDKDGASPDKEICDLVVELTAVSSPLKENHNPHEGSSLCTGLNKARVKRPRRKDHCPKVIRGGKPKRTLKPATPKAQSKENIAERKYVRRKELNNTSTPATEVIEEVTEKIPEAAQMSCGRSLNFEIGTKDESSAGKENGVAVQEMNVGLAYDLNTFIKHASNSSMSFPEVTQVPVKKRVRRKLKRTPAPPREVTGELTTEKMSELAQPPCNVSTYFDGGMEESSAVKENVVVKGTYPDLAYVRSPGLNKSSTPTEVSGDLPGKTMPERGESSATRENAIGHPCIETCTVLQEIEVGLAYDVKVLMKQAAENNYPSFCNNEHTLTVHPSKEIGAELQDIDNEQTLATSPSKTNSPEEKPRNMTEKKYHRIKQLNKSPTGQTKMTGGLTGVLMPESKETTMSRFSGSDMEANANINPWMKQALHSYIALPNGERKCVRKKRSNMTFTPKKMTGELTKPIMSKPTIMPCRMSINLDTGGRDESSMCNESLTNDQNTLLKEIVHNYTSLSVNTEAPSTCLPKCNPPGIKRNARNKNKRKGLAARNKNKRKGLAEVEYENISNGQVSTVNLQMEMVGSEREHSETTERGNNGQASTVKLLMEMVGCEREHPGIIERADNSSVNLIGAHYNGLHSYQSKFPLQFPKIHKKRRTEKGKTSVITKNGVPPIFAPEDAEVHPYASNYSNLMYDLGYNVPQIINESRENYIHNTQTFDEFRLSLRKMAAISQLPNQTRGYSSLMRTRNCTEANYNAKQLDFSDLQTIREAGTPQKCIDVLVEDMPVSRTKKKQIRKRSSLSSSNRPKKDEMPQCHNSSLAGVFLTQNVTDHISSSAFMSLAARFPKKLASMCTACDGESMSMAVNKQQVREVEPEKNTECDVNLLNQSVCNLSSITVEPEKNTECDVNSNDSCRITSSSISLTDESDCKQTESPQRNNTECHSPMDVIEEGEEKSCHDDIGKESNDMVSSQSSVVSSQISGDFSNDHIPEKKESCSDSNSEIEDLSSTAKYNTCGSISKLLETEQEQSNHTQQSFFDIAGQTLDLIQKVRDLNFGDHKDVVRSKTNEMTSDPIKLKTKKQLKEEKEQFDLDSLRRKAQAKAGKREKTEDTMDSVDGEAMGCANVQDIANTIKERGMDNRLAERIQNFLKRLVDDHGIIDLECLRDIPPDQAKEYLLIGIEKCRVCAPVNTAPTCLHETHE
ncbi:uncharacterized protein LOC131652840 isoform X2 [Vicia villosa]|uniref:uncharacterized protein LOC131652840 isoform X2 n=1 Tax=Vicia villosa TaxID=3911 RepID=UPI00273CDFE9|nr:uncharacterized protein LOC131652840 isoform X2 [Vicia villosa]